MPPHAEPEGKANSTAEPEVGPGPEPGAEPGAEPGPNAEPVPEWPAAHEIWGGAWELHYIGLGILFLCVAIWSVIALLHVRKRKLLATRRFCYSVNFLLIVFGTSRGLAMFLFPYEMVRNAPGTPLIFQRLLFGIGFPCLTAGFSLIHFAFLEAAKVSHGRRRIQSLRFLIALIVVHFALEIVSEFTTSYVANTTALFVTCMVYFITFALAISASVLYSGFKVINSSKSNRRTMRKISLRDSEGTRVGTSRHSKPNDKKYCNRESNTHKVAYVTMVSACLGIACAATQIYAMVCVFKVMDNPTGATPPEPWPWWSYQTVFRLIELAFAVTMAFTISHPKKGGYFKGWFAKWKRSGHDNIVLTNSSAHTLSDGSGTRDTSVRSREQQLN